MEIIFLGFFVLIGFVWGRSYQRKHSYQITDVDEQRNQATAIQDVLVLQHLFRTLYQFQKAKVLRKAKVNQLLAHYYHPTGPLGGQIDRLHANPYYREQIQAELKQLRNAGYLSPEELEACLQYLISPASKPSETLVTTVTTTSTDPAPSELFSATAQPLSSEPPPVSQALSSDPLGRWFSRAEYFFNTGKANWLTFLGVILVVISSLPVIQNLGSATTIYLVLLLYSIGLFGTGYLVWRFFPWTGQVFYLVTLLIIPMDFMSITGLDLSEGADLAVTVVAFISLSAIAWAILKRLLPQLPFFYFVALISLGVCAAFMKDIETVVAMLGGGRIVFEYVVLLLPLCFLLLGLFYQNRLLAITENRHNLHEILWPNALLAYAYLLVPAVNNVASYRLGSGGLFLSLAFFLTAGQLRQHLNTVLGVTWPKEYFRLVLEIELCGYVLSLAGLGATLHEPKALIVSVSFVAPLYVLQSWNWHSHWFRWVLYGLSSACVGTWIYFMTIEWPSDAQSLLMAAVALALMVVGHKRWAHPTLQTWWQEAFAYTAVLASGVTWIILGQFEEWSMQTLYAMGLTTLLYVVFAIYQKRNVVGYLAVGTFVITAFSTLSVWQPLMEFETYRYYALGLSYGLLGLGYLIQRVSKTQAEVTPAASQTGTKNWRSWLTTDMIQPFHFQQRFRSPWPYLFSEPMYNLALLIASVALLFDLGDYPIAIAAMSFYGLIFLIYPSRIWLYFVITAATDGILGLITDVLPSKYHNLGLVFLSMGWFFVGVMVEELLSAHDRKRPEPVKLAQQRLYAQPFFHGAIFANLLLLRYYFGDLQSVFTEEGWNKMTQEMTPVLLTSFFYVLKIRVYVSKLWLYPGIITGTLGLYFGLTSLFPVEYPLLILTAIAFLWWGLGILINRHAGVQHYLRDMVHHRLPDLQPDSRLYRVHIADFASPFYTFGLLLVVVMLAFSAVLIPQQSALFNREFEFALRQAHPATLYAVQSVNFALLTLFLALYYPRRIPLLEGGYESREKPWQLDFLPLISGVLGLLWLLSEYMTRANLPLVMAGLALAGLGLSTWFHHKSATRAYWATFQTAQALASVAWLLIMSKNGLENLVVLALLAIFYMGSLWLTHQPVWLYVSGITVLVEALAYPIMLPETMWSISPKFVPLCLTIVAWFGWLWRRHRDPELEPHWQYLILVFVTLAGCFAVPEIQTVWGVNGEIYGWSSSMAQMNSLVRWESTLHNGFSYLSLYLAVLLLIHRHLNPQLGWGWFFAGALGLWSLFLSLSDPFYFLLVLAGLTTLLLVPKRWPWPDKWIMLAQPLEVLARWWPLVLLLLYFWMPEVEQTYLYLSIRFTDTHWNWIFAAAFLGALHHAAVAYTEQRNGFWWWAAFLFQWVWIGGGLRLLQISDRYLGSGLIWWQAVMLELGLAMVLLGYFTLKKSRNRTQLMYIGLFLPLLTFGIQILYMGINGNSEYGDYRGIVTWGSICLLLAIETGLYLFSVTRLGIRFKLRPLLYFGLNMTWVSLFLGLVGLLVVGNWVMRWSLFISVGGAFIVLGTFFQAKNEQVLQSISRYYQTVAAWEE